MKEIKVLLKMPYIDMYIDFTFFFVLRVIAHFNEPYQDAVNAIPYHVMSVSLFNQ